MESKHSRLKALRACRQLSSGTGSQSRLSWQAGELFSPLSSLLLALLSLLLIATAPELARAHDPSIPYDFERDCSPENLVDPISGNPNYHAFPEDSTVHEIAQGLLEKYPNYEVAFEDGYRPTVPAFLHGDIPLNVETEYALGLIDLEQAHSLEENDPLHPLGLLFSGRFGTDPSTWQLIGSFYGAHFEEDDTGPPELPGVLGPEAAASGTTWFLHEAGYHDIGNGIFVPATTDDLWHESQVNGRWIDTSGCTTISDDDVRAASPGGLLRHERAWALHFWFDPETGAPVMGIRDPWCRQPDAGDPADVEREFFYQGSCPTVGAPVPPVLNPVVAAVEARMNDVESRLLDAGFGVLALDGIEGWFMGLLIPEHPPAPQAILTQSCEEAYGGGLQAHGTEGRISFHERDRGERFFGSRHLRANNVDSRARNCSEADGSNAARCVAVGIAPSLLPPAFETSVGGDDHELTLLSPRGARVFTDTFEFESVVMKFAATVRFKGPSGSAYHIRDLAVGALGKLFLAPGDYFVENLAMSPLSRVIATGDGVVRLHLLNPPALQPWVDLNWDAGKQEASQDPARLVIFAHDELTIPSGGRAAAYIYSQAEGHLDTASRVAGSIAGSSLLFEAAARVTDLTSGVAGLDFGGICTSQSPRAFGSRLRGNGRSRPGRSSSLRR